MRGPAELSIQYQRFISFLVSKNYLLSLRSCLRWAVSLCASWLVRECLMKHMVSGHARTGIFPFPHGARGFSFFDDKKGGFLCGGCGAELWVAVEPLFARGSSHTLEFPRSFEFRRFPTHAIDNDIRASIPLRRCCQCVYCCHAPYSTSIATTVR